MTETNVKSLSLVKLQLIREQVEYYSDKKVNNPNDLEEVVRKLIGESDREIFIAVHLSTDNKINAAHVISIGTLDTSLVHPRECFKAALLSNARSIVFAHNHPSGNSTPSTQDREITDKLKQCGELLGIKVLDHVIIGNDSYYSFAENNLV